MYFCGLIGHQDKTSLSLAYEGRKTQTVRQCDCHNHKGDLYAEREHGGRVNLETDSQRQGEGTLWPLLRPNTLGHNMKTAREERKEKENKKEKASRLEKIVNRDRTGTAKPCLSLFQLECVTLAKKNGDTHILLNHT